MQGAWLVAVILFVAAVVFARVMVETGMPATIALVVFGVVAGSMLPNGLHFSLGPGMLALFLPALIFEAAWDSDASALRRTALPIAVLAGPGVIATAAIVAAGAVASHVVAWQPALVLGAIVAATDPVAVLAMFRNLGLPHDLVTIVEGESVANDGVAVVLVQGLVAFALSGSFARGPWGEAASMLAESAGGVAIGVSVALVASVVLRARIGTPGRVAATLAVAYGAYVAAMAVHASGIFATAAAGVALRASVPIAPASAEARAIDRTWDAIAFTVNAVVFLLVGLTLRLDRVFGEPVLFATVAVSLVGARALLAYLLVPLSALTNEPLAWRHTIALAGLRGGLSLALALGLPPSMPGRAAVIDAVFAVVFLTLVVQGPVLAPVLGRLSRGGRPATLEEARGIERP